MLLSLGLFFCDVILELRCFCNLFIKGVSFGITYIGIVYQEALPLKQIKFTHAHPRVFSSEKTENYTLYKKARRGISIRV